MIGDILQPTHLVFILLVALLVLGPKRLPEVGRSLGRGIRDFRGALSGVEDHFSTSPVESPEPQTSVAPITPATTAMPQEPPTVALATDAPPMVGLATEVPAAAPSEAERGGGLAGSRAASEPVQPEPFDYAD